jgi:hypothetical protein
MAPKKLDGRVEQSEAPRTSETLTPGGDFSLNGAINEAEGRQTDPGPSLKAPEIQPAGSFLSIKEAFADMSQPPLGGSKENFIRLYGVAALNAYLVSRQATITYPLLLALHRHLDMAEKRGEMEVALTSAVWEDAGVPPKSKRTRETMLAHLRRMPDLVVFHDNRTLFSAIILGKGPAWRRMEEAAGKGKRGRKGGKE